MYSQSLVQTVYRYYLLIKDKTNLSDDRTDCLEPYTHKQVLIDPSHSSNQPRKQDSYGAPLSNFEPIKWGKNVLSNLIVSTTNLNKKFPLMPSTKAITYS